MATEAAYDVSASRASSGSAHFSSQSSSGMPRPPIARTCGKCTWVSTKPGSTSPSRRSTTSSAPCTAAANGSRATITPSSTTSARSASARRWPPVKGLRGVSRKVPRKTVIAGGHARRALSRSKAASSAAATETAIAAGSLLVVTPGRPIGVSIRSTTSGAWPDGQQLGAEPRPLGRRPDQPDRARGGRSAARRR